LPSSSTFGFPLTASICPYALLWATICALLLAYVCRYSSEQKALLKKAIPLLMALKLYQKKQSRLILIF
jgi:hypothetical protein